MADLLLNIKKYLADNKVTYYNIIHENDIKQIHDFYFKNVPNNDISQYDLYDQQTPNTDISQYDLYDQPLANTDILQYDQSTIPTNTSPIVKFYCGLYCEITKQFPDMINFYIDANTIDSMYRLGDYYVSIRDHVNAYTYYIISINLMTLTDNTMWHKYVISTTNVAMFWFACKQQILIAMKLGDYYQTKQQYASMFRYYNKAAELGYITARLTLAKCYEQLGDEQNMLLHFEIAHKNKNTYATYKLAKYFEKNTHYDRAFKYYAEASKNGHAKASFRLAKYYQHHKKYTTMKIYYVEAITNGHALSMYELANHFLKTKKYTSMVKYFLMYIKCEGAKDVYIIYEIMDACHSNNHIKECAELYDTCLDVLHKYSTDECPICFDGEGKYQTSCCNKYIHYACVAQCNTCPLCRNPVF